MSEENHSDSLGTGPSAAGFLSGGGEMGKLIRENNWEKTLIGPIHLWPQSLCTTLSIILRSKFPMVVLWGDEYIFFYNDAYRPTLGNDNKHPHVLGKPGSEIWKEGWKAVKPLIDKVYKEGESVLLEDQLIPIYRNGRNEDVYWTFSYSPVADESGITAGVIITCFETTENIIRAESFKESTRSLEMAMEIAELGVFKVDLVKDRSVYSPQIMDFLGLKKQNLPLSEIMAQIHPEDQVTVKDLINRSIDGEGGGKHDFVYRVLDSKNNSIKYLHSIGQVVYTDGKATAITGIIQDVSREIISKKILEDREKAFRNLVMQAPVAIAVFRGQNFIADIVNDACLKLIGKARNAFLGKPLFESFSEIKEELEPVAKEVLRSGKPFSANEYKYKLHRQGRNQLAWFNFVWEPYFDNEGKPDGFMAVMHEITDQVLARKKIEESEFRYRTLIEESTVAAGLYIGPEFEVRYANDILLGYWGKDKSVLGKPLGEAVPELKGQPFIDYLEKVFASGETYEGVEEPTDLRVNGKLQTFYFSFTYKALRDYEGKIYGIHHIAIDVTGEVLAKKAVLENEEQLRIAVEGGELGTYSFYPKTGEAIWSVKTKEFYGLPPEAEVTNELYMAAIHPEDREKVKRVLQKVVSGKGYYELEYRTIGITDGILRWIRPKGKVFFDEDGKAERITGIIQDITEQKLAENALKESKDRFQAAVEAIEGILWTNNARGEMEGEQPGWEAITGQSFEEYQGFGWAKAVHPDDAQATIDAWKKALEKKETFIFEHRLKLKNGSWGYFSIRAIPLLNADGTIREWVGVHTNITEQKIAELGLKESEARFRSLADQSPMIVYIMEPNEMATMSYFNKTWLEYTGQTFEEALGRAWNGIVHPEDLQTFLNIYATAYHKRESYTIPAIRFKRYDGDYRWHLSKGNPRYLADGKFMGYVGVGIDIHEQKLALEQLELNNAQLKRINNDLDNFIYTASHDLKAPMSNIEGLLGALRSSIEIDPTILNNEHEVLLNLMEQSVNRFKDTLLDLTDISKAQREQEEDVNEVKLEEIIDDVKFSIQDKIEESKAHIETDLSEADSIRFSRKNIKSIVYNLLSNAIKYRDMNRVPEVFIKTEQTENYIVLIVKDNGLGIPQGNLDKVFTMFKRLHDHVEGTGIGLYIVKRIIDNSGGKVEVKSEEGKGTTFRVYFAKENHLTNQ